jgi:hypothetical protein
MKRKVAEEIEQRNSESSSMRSSLVEPIGRGSFFGLGHRTFSDSSTSSVVKDNELVPANNTSGRTASTNNPLATSPPNSSLLVGSVRSTGAASASSSIQGSNREQHAPTLRQSLSAKDRPNLDVNEPFVSEATVMNMKKI